MTEQEAFEKMKTGDQDALSWVYRNYRDRIAHFFMGKYAGCTEEEARDIAQDAVVQLAESLEKGKMHELSVQLLTLLIGIAKRKYAAAKRKRQLPYSNTDPSLMPDDQDEPFNDDFINRLELEEILESLKPLVEEMGEPCRTILTEYYWMDKTDREIGEKMDKTAAATKMKRRHCIDLLRKQINNRKK